METAAKIEMAMRVVALAAALSLCLNLTIWATIEKYDGWEWYDTYRKRWMPARTCMLCMAHLIGYIYTVPAVAAAVVALRSAAPLILLAVPLLVSAPTLLLATRKK